MFRISTITCISLMIHLTTILGLPSRNLTSSNDDNLKFYPQEILQPNNHQDKQLHLQNVEFENILEKQENNLLELQSRDLNLMEDQFLLKKIDDMVIAENLERKHQALSELTTNFNTLAQDVGKFLFITTGLAVIFVFCVADQ